MPRPLAKPVRHDTKHRLADDFFERDGAKSAVLGCSFSLIAASRGAGDSHLLAMSPSKNRCTGAREASFSPKLGFQFPRGQKRILRRRSVTVFSLGE